MSEYKGNSHREREAAEEKKQDIKPVVKGKVQVKKEPLSRKFSDVFLQDNISNVKSYLIFDVLVPAIKDTIVDLITNGANMLAYGSSSGRRSNKKSGERTSYSSYYRGSENRSENRRPTRDRRGYADIIFETRGDAQEVMDCMDEVLEKYKVISIADFYELADATDLAEYTDNKYGWYDLSGMAITRDHEGYRIKLPKPEALD